MSTTVPTAPPAAWCHVVIAAIGILICTGGPSTFSTLHLVRIDPSAFIWTNLYPFLTVAVVGTFLLAGALRERPLRRVPWPVFAVAAYVSWALVSALWSSTPASTPVAAAVGVGIAAFGCWIGLSLSVEEQITSVMFATTAAVLLSIPVIVFRPAYGREPVLAPGAGGEWMGIYGNRNSLAAVSALGIIAVVGFALVRRTPTRIVAAVLIGIVDFVVLWGTHGDTSRITLVLCVVAALAIPCLWTLRKLRVPGVAVAAFGVASLGAGWVILFNNIDAIAKRFGMDPTLSQRTLIWRHVRGFIHEHPVRGYGFWGFWDNPTLTYNTYHSIGKAYASAHNSVLEVLLMLGVIGLIPYLGIVLGAVVGISRWVWSHRSISAWWWTVVLVYLIAQNMTESFVLWHSYNWVLVIAASIVPYTSGRVTTPAAL